MILVTINDRLGTKTQVPCLPSDPIKLLKAMVAAKIGRPVHEIMLKRQGERPFHDNLTKSHRVLYALILDRKHFPRC